MLDPQPDTNLMIIDPSISMPEGREGASAAKGGQGLPGRVEGTFYAITAFECHHHLSMDEMVKGVQACIDLLAVSSPRGLFEHTSFIPERDRDGRALLATVLDGELQHPGGSDRPQR